MHLEDRDKLVRSIYDAALDSDKWPAMLSNIASAMNCAQSNFVIADPYIGTTQLIAPMWREDDRNSFFSHWQREFTIADKLRDYPVGRIVDYEEMFEVEWLRRTAFYNEWWLPQGVGGGSFAANVVADGRAIASLTVHAPISKRGFSTSERRLFQEITYHVTRSVEVIRRLQVARLITKQTGGDTVTGFAVVDKSGSILHTDAGTLAWLEALSIVQAQSGGSKVAPGNLYTALRRVIEDQSSASLSLLDKTGKVVRLTIIPCSPGSNLELFTIDRPAALLWLTSIDEVQKEKIRRLTLIYSLTDAESRIATEACRGGGRKEIARRCNVSPSTVRTHMEAIYFKTGVHKHAELVHLVETI